MKRISDIRKPRSSRSHYRWGILRTIFLGTFLVGTLLMMAVQVAAKDTKNDLAWQQVTQEAGGYWQIVDIIADMPVLEGDIKTSFQTNIFQGQSECSEQVYQTYLASYIDEVYVYGKLAYATKFINAQEYDPIIGEGNFINNDPFDDDETGWAEDLLVLEFSPSGGTVKGFGFIDSFIRQNGYYQEFIISGEFDCSDDGKIGGTVVSNIYTYNYKFSTRNEGTFSGSDEGVWNGQLFADGTGYGNIDLPSAKVDWEITFAPENFCRVPAEEKPAEPSPEVIEEPDPEQLIPEQPKPDVESPEVSSPDSDYDWPSSGPSDYDSNGSLLGPIAIIGVLGALGAVGIVGAAAAAILAGVLKGRKAGAVQSGISRQGPSQKSPRGHTLPDNFIQNSQFGSPSDNPHINYEHQDDECRPF